MTDFPDDPHRGEPELLISDWLLAFATALVALIVIGVIPHLQW
jgi:hypothetical protein